MQEQFPGRWIGGCSLLLAPMAMLAGILLRIPYHFFFPQQLAAYEKQPELMWWAYTLFVAGNVVLWPGVLAIVRMIGVTQPVWALAGGTLTIFGLFARTFHAGVDHLAFQLVTLEGAEKATRFVASSYGAFHIFQIVSFAIFFGWPVLAIGAYRSRTLGLVRSVALGSMMALMIGVLKGSSLTSVAVVSGLCVAFVPLGVEVLRGRVKVP